MKLINTYKDYTITFDGDKYEILLDNIIQTNKPKSLESCVTWIDNQTKQKFTRTKVLVSSWLEVLKPAEATSIVGNKAWVVYEDDKREMVTLDNLKAFTESNLAIEQRYLSLKKQAAKFEEEASKLKESLETFDSSKMIV